MDNQLTLDISKKIFNEVYIPYLTCMDRLQILFGGSSSGKSVFKADQTIIDVLNGRNYLICRKTGNTLRKSTFNEMKKSIVKLQVAKYFNINKSDMIITCKLNKSQALFVGLDDVEKVKSITPEIGVITDIWIEEATEIEENDFKQLQKRLRGTSKFKKRIHLTFNPIYKSHWIYKKIFKGKWDEEKRELKQPGLSILKTTYKDNKFLEPDDIKALEDEEDPYYFDVYTLGNWGTLGHIIYKNWTLQDFDTKVFDNYHNGIDWGFSSHPFAFVRIHYDRTRKKIYICKEICETNLLNTESAAEVKAIIGNEKVICDSAEPKSVREYQQLGINAYSAVKGKGSIENGIKFIQEHEIIIHPSCQNFVNQIEIYKYKEDKDGNALPKPLDKNDDLLDALRYALEAESLRTEIKEKDRPKTAKELRNSRKAFITNLEQIEDSLGIEWHGNQPHETNTRKRNNVTGY